MFNTRVCLSGMEYMYQLTHNRKYTLRVDLEDFEGRKGSAVYSLFSVDSECEGYRLTVSGFKDAGAGTSHFHFILESSGALI